MEGLSKNMKTVIDNYLQKTDWRVKENSNMAYSLQGLNIHVAEYAIKDYWLSEVYPKYISDAHRNGDIHIHDLGTLGAYCVGWDLMDLIKNGFGGVRGKISSRPPKRFRVALMQVVNFIYTLQGESAGAQALSNFDTLLAPFVKNENLSYSEVKQAIQEFVYNMNVPTRVGFQSPFSNCTFDLTVPSYLAGNPAIVGGILAPFTYGDVQPEMDMINRAFAEIMLEGDAVGRPFAFPIPTYNITKDFRWGDKNFYPIWEMTAKYGIPYFSNFINSDMKPEDARSMCPLTQETKVLVLNDRNETSVQDIIHIIRNMENGTEYKVYTNSGWKNATPIIVNNTRVIEVKLSNGESVRFGENHLQPTKDDGLIKASELRVGMWLPFNKTKMDTNSRGSYEYGFAVGAFLGDGSFDDSSIVYSLNAGPEDDVTELQLGDFWVSQAGFNMSSKETGKLRTVRISARSKEFIDRFVYGDGAINKRINTSVFGMSFAFRTGIIDGFSASDGSKEKRRLYTSSVGLRDDLSMIISSLGEKYLHNYVDEREDRFSEKPNYRIDFPTRSRYGDLYDEDDSYNYYRIVSINDVDYRGKLYCFEVESQEDRLFMLANGLITHNCRLRINNGDLRRRGGGLFGSNPKTGSIGVVTVNLPRIARKSKSVDEFYTYLKEIMNLSKESLIIKRNVIEHLSETGLYPYSVVYLKDIRDSSGGYWKNHFSTIGIIGMNEAGNLLGIGGTDTVEGHDFAYNVLMFMRKTISEFQHETGDLFNLEATPAEGASRSLAGKDGHCNPYYTNSTQLPVDHGLGLFESLDMQDDLQSLYTGGSVFHAYLGERMPDAKSVEGLVRIIAENYSLPYFSITPTFSICPKHGYIVGENPSCPDCGTKTEVYSRVVGYIRPVEQWNDGKVEEFKNRTVYSNDGSVYSRRKVN